MALKAPILGFFASFALAASALPGLAQDAPTAEKPAEAATPAAEAAAPAAPAPSDAAPPAAEASEAAEAPAAPEPEEEEVVKRECHLFGVTWDGGSKAGARKRAQRGLRETISDFRRKQGRRSGWLSDSVTIEPHRMRPNPYWRSRVAGSLYLRPDARTKTSYTVCWKGVISTAVCTAGAKVCK